MVNVCVGIVVALFLSAFFSGAEMAFVSLDKVFLRRKPTPSDHDVLRIKRIMRKPMLFINAVLIGNNIALVMASSLATILVSSIFPLQGEMFVQVLVVSVLTPIVVLCCEIVPKGFCALHAKKVCRMVNVPILILMYLCMPVIATLAFLAQFFMKPFKGAEAKRSFITRQELRAVFAESMLAGAITNKEKQFIDTVLNFDHTLVRNKMTPVDHVAKVDVNDSLECLKALARETPRSRFFVEDKKTGDVLGFVNIFDVLFDDARQGTVSDYMRTPLFVKEDITLHEAFVKLQHAREWILFAVGQDDKITGLLTLKDIVY